MTTTLKTLMRLKLQRTAAASAAVAARAPSPQANEHRMAKETGGNGYVYTSTREEIKHSLFKFTARRRCNAGPMYYYGSKKFVSCINMWYFQPGRRRSLAFYV